MEFKIVELEESGLSAHIKPSITYGEHQAMQAVLMGGAKGNVNPSTQEYKAEFDATTTIEWTFKKLLIMVVKLTDKDDKTIPVNRKTLEELPMNDGQKLEEAVDEILDALKKKQKVKE